MFSASPLSADQLGEIEQEVRRCFIDEDGPEYLGELEQGILRLSNNAAGENLGEVWRDVLRAAHTLKGGAGLAQLYAMGQLAHRCEDVLVALRDRRFVDRGAVYPLLLDSMDAFRELFGRAMAGEADPASGMVARLEQLLQGCTDPGSEAEGADSAASADGSAGAARLVLDGDFAQCLEAVAQGLAGEAAQDLAGLLGDLAETCQGLGEILNLPWLRQSGDVIQAHRTEFTLEQAVEMLAYLEAARGSAIAGHVPQAFRWGERSAPEGESAGALVGSVDAGENLSSLEANPGHSPNSPVSVSVSAPRTASTSSANTSSEVTMRVPVQRLDRLADTVGEMYISYESLNLEQQRLARSNRELRRWTRQFYRVKEQIQNLYDQLLLPTQTLAAQRSGGAPTGLSAVSTVLGGLTTGAKSQQGKASLAAEGNWAGNRAGNWGADFDALEMDRFTELHTVLQDFQEMLTRIEENAEDIQLFGQATHDAMTLMRTQMGSLRQGLMDARMVPFSLLGDRFRRPLWDLNQRFGKVVQLQIEGGDTPIDRAILEQLYEPLLHLVRNAFDHGIESPEQRRQGGKPEAGNLWLRAQQQGTQVVIQVRDDGRGIDLDQVRRKAESLGLLPAQPPSPPSPEHILACLFAPGFSTAAVVGELSGRGVGLDVVQAQVEQLRGSVQVWSELGQGTTFQMAVPLSLNILPMLICQSQRSQGLPALIAIPSAQIVDLIELDASAQAEGALAGGAASGPAGSLPSRASTLTWQDLTLPILDLTDLLHLQGASQQLSHRATLLENPSFQTATTIRAGIAIILKVQEKTVALRVEQLLGEQEMVLKPFARLVPVPSYLSGCTILPTGQAIPVLLADALPMTSPEAMPDVLPLAMPETGRSSRAEYQSVTPAQPLEGSAASTRQFLVVDDSLTSRRWIARSLEKLGYQVVQCRDGQEAWEVLQKGGHFDLLISDVEMPRMDGFQLLQQVRRDARFARIPVALLTSRQGDRHVLKALDLGANGYYTKPLGNQLLLQQLEPLLQGETLIVEPTTALV